MMMTAAGTIPAAKVLVIGAGGAGLQAIATAKRNAKSLLETIDFIMKNYSHIQDSIRKNSLPTKEKFISDMAHILKSN